MYIPLSTTSKVYKCVLFIYFKSQKFLVLERRNNSKAILESTVSNCALRVVVVRSMILKARVIRLSFVKLCYANTSLFKSAAVLTNGC